MGGEGGSTAQGSGEGGMAIGGDPDLELALQLSMQEEAGDASQHKEGMDQVNNNKLIC